MIELLCQKSPYKILLLGDEKDTKMLGELAQHLRSSTKARLINGVCKFHISNLSWLINLSRFVICPNTSIYHLCLLAKKPCVCVCAHSYKTLDFSQSCNEYVLYDDYTAHYDGSWEHKISQIPTKRLQEAVLRMIERAQKPNFP